ncbi:sulfatase-like hydrolase/transferase [Roseiconus nitratireducens]|uniref:Sulfatase-like hydrolase/transferase n=1 Tax=Roseiconus nitratireducens TaxID=2605748 RepID=A0A5M6CY60_9BACT|nr:sulfatase-like hydrolase/transferase [Roseiconus nitratireducens]KAA5539876.1 sulfatase-like hydrolase/transferase [Roseiconus nitratireducens]
MKNRNELFLCLLWTIFVAVPSLGAAADKSDRPPNVVMIMADDIGVECLGCYGSEQYATPHLDGLAQQGMRFENAHAQPICTPSRVQLMTGIYNNRNYLRFGVLDPAAYTFGNALRGAGYATCIAGKWQLGGGFDGPRRFGFDRYCLWQLTRRPSRYPNPGFEIDGREVDFKEGQFGPDVASDYINSFISEHADRPFFVYYPMIAPHWPFVPTPDHPDWDPTMWRDKKSEPGGYKDDKYWDAMVRYTDKVVGKVVDHLDACGLADNTLVMWTGDNGTYQSVTSQWRGRDYVGGKGRTTDNGTHVGFLARWPGVIEPGSVSDTLVDFSDVFPTLLEVTGVKRPTPGKLSGVSLLPAFTGQARKKPVIYCWYERNGVRDQASEHVRTATHKLYADGRFYDVQNDWGEKHDLAAEPVSGSLREIHAKLEQELDKHRQMTLQADPILSQRRQAYPR